MNIDLNTKALDLLNEYPWLVDEIKKMGEGFEIIDSPLAKLFLRSATIGDICKKFNLDETQVIAQITNMIENHKKAD